MQNCSKLFCWPKSSNPKMSSTPIALPWKDSTIFKIRIQIQTTVFFSDEDWRTNLVLLSVLFWQQCVIHLHHDPIEEGPIQALSQCITSGYGLSKLWKISSTDANINNHHLNLKVNDLRKLNLFFSEIIASLPLLTDCLPMYTLIHIQNRNVYFYW